MLSTLDETWRLPTLTVMESRKLYSVGGHEIRWCRPATSEDGLFAEIRNGLGVAVLGIDNDGILEVVLGFHDENIQPESNHNGR